MLQPARDRSSSSRSDYQSAGDQLLIYSARKEWGGKKRRKGKALDSRDADWTGALRDDAVRGFFSQSRIRGSVARVATSPGKKVRAGGETMRSNSINLAR